MARSGVPYSQQPQLVIIMGNLSVLCGCGVYDVCVYVTRSLHMYLNRACEARRGRADWLSTNHQQLVAK